MIKTVIFDIGNVLTHFGWQDYIKSFGYSEEIEERVARATVLNPDWKEYDLGNMTTEEVIELFKSYDPGVAKEIEEVNRNVKHILERADYAIDWIEHIKAMGYQALYLSNFSEKCMIDCAHAMDFLPHLDGGIFSYKVHQIKPEPYIYETIIREYRLVPSQCVFIDDMPDNVEAARRAGLNAIHFTGYAEARAALDDFLRTN